MINENYDLEFIAVSHDPKRPAFSENTALSEAIYVARKRKGIADRTDKFLFASLWRGLSSINEAQSAARAILEADDSGEDCGDLKRGEEKIGEFARLPYRKRGDVVVHFFCQCADVFCSVSFCREWFVTGPL